MKRKDGFAGARAPALAVFALLVIGSGDVPAATPDRGTLNPTSDPLTYDSGPFVQSNPTPSQLDDGPRCNAQFFCDSYRLTVALSPTYADDNPNDFIRITTSWTPEAADLDVWVFRGDVGNVNGSNPGYKSAASLGNPEIVILPVENGTNVYTIKIVPYAASGASARTTIELLKGLPPPPPPTSDAGRHTVLMSPPGLGDSAGEPSVGFNLKTKRAMFIAILETLKVTFPEHGDLRDAAGDKLPLACDAQWEDVTFPGTGTFTVDPILFTNQSLGDSAPNRTFVSQLTGANSLFAWTEDDGVNWTPAQQGPPNGGVDHQTVGAGPYPPPSATFPGPPPANPGYAVYYCSQSIADAFCARSDTGGQTFGPGVPMGKATALGCETGDLGALHGHARVSDNGDLAVPFGQCAGQQGFLLSTDAGNTWSAKKVPDTTAGDDPQLAWSRPDAQGKVTGYLCMVDGDGKPKVSVTRDRGGSWTPPYDLGAQHNLRNAVFSQGIAGDPDRAACAFLGTTRAGNINDENFPGIWYGYVAYTYDGGASWNTVNVTPNDPVQGIGGICIRGTSCGSNRNLLDFNEMALDDKGRVLFSYADGCISTSCVNGTATTPQRAAKAALVRQIGGRSLYSEFDSEVPTVPQPPCLLDKALGHQNASTRDASGSKLNWKVPDDGGKPITGYNIYRSTAVGGPYTLVGSTTTKTAFDDDTADPGVPLYYYKVTPRYDGGGSQVEGRDSNRIRLAVGVLPPPGKLVLYMHGNPVHDAGHPDEPFCTGTGSSDVVACDGPFLSPVAQLANAAAAHWDPPVALDGTNPRNIYDPQWHWPLVQPAVLESPMKVEFWASCGGCGGPLPADWQISLYVDGGLVVQQTVRATPSAPNVTNLLTVTLPLPAPAVVASGNVLLHIDPVFIDTQENTHIYYDSVFACPGSSDPARPCNSRVSFGPDLPPPPGNPCEIPGQTAVLDPEGDATTGSPQHDVLSVKYSEPDPRGGPDKLVTTLRVRDLSTLAPNTIYYVTFKLADGKTYYVSWDPFAAPGFPAFTYGELVPGDNGGPGSFEQIGAADPESAFDPVGNIVIYLSKSKLPALATTATLTEVVGEARALLGGAGTGVVMVVDDTSQGSYGLVGNVTCIPNTAPLPDLSADPQNGEAPLIVDFDASRSEDPDSIDTVVEFTFDFGDGSPPVTQASPFARHTYTGPGLWPARLTVRDSRGMASASWSERVIGVIEGNPVAILAPSQSEVWKGTRVTLDGGSSHAAGNNTIVAYTFHPGEPGSASVTQPEATFEHRYLKTGAHTAWLVVKDQGERFSARAERVVTVINRAPVAVLGAGPTSGHTPLDVQFDPTGSFDPDTDPEAGVVDFVKTYDLDFGDGTRLTGEPGPLKVHPHTYTAPDTYDVLLTVYDSEDLASASAAMIQIFVPNRLPVAQLTAGPKVQGKNRPVTLDASRSSDPEGPLVSYRFDAGDGSPLVTGGSSTVSHTYARQGTYVAKVTVRDSSGAESSGSDEVTITNAVPVAVLTASATESLPTDRVTFSGEGSSDADTGDSVASYTFNFGDGSAPVTQATPTVSKLYERSGTYEVTLTVRDQEGAQSDPATVSVKISVGDDTHLLGGGLSPWALALLVPLALIRRRGGQG